MVDGLLRCDACVHSAPQSQQYVVYAIHTSLRVRAGPDAYRDLPRLLRAVDGGAATAMNVQLSLEESYADVAPVRVHGAAAASVSITRGCNNMCSFCIVPFTRCALACCRNDGTAKVLIFAGDLIVFVDMCKACSTCALLGKLMYVNKHSANK